MNYNEIIADLRKLADNGNVDNNDLTEILRKHGCFYLLSKIPSYTNLKTQLLANKLLIKHRYEACADLFDELEPIKYAVIKGAVLSNGIYGNSAYRLSGDIDILTSPENAEYVKSVLQKNRFIQGRIADGEIVPYTRRELIYQKTFSHQLPAFVKKTSDVLSPFINIDVNTDIMWGESKVKTDMKSFLEGVITSDKKSIAVFNQNYFDDKLDCTKFVPIDISSALNNKAFASHGLNREHANLSDTDHFYVVEDSLQGKLSYREMTFDVLIDSADSEFDNISCCEQTLEITQGVYTHLLYIGCAQFGNQEWSIKLITDIGESISVPMKISDWRSESSFHEEVIYKGQCWQIVNELKNQYLGNAHLFLQCVRLLSDINIKEIILLYRPNINIFSLGLLEK